MLNTSLAQHADKVTDDIAHRSGFDHRTTGTRMRGRAKAAEVGDEEAVVVLRGSEGVGRGDGQYSTLNS
jgi:hypothetical protein